MLTKIIDRCIIFDVPYKNLDFNTAKIFKRNLLNVYLSSCYSNMILNLENVTYIDSEGLEALLFAGSLVQEAKGKISLFGLNSFVKQVLLQSRLYRFFDINRDLEESLEFINDTELSEMCNYKTLRKKINNQIA